MTGVLKIFLARHGESLANHEKRVSGQLDSPLSAKGEQQAQWLCDVLKDEPLDAIFTSNLSRTIDTARSTALHHDLAIQVVEDFKEMSFGRMQGHKHQQLSYDQPSLDASQFRKIESAGESSEDFCLRIERALVLILGSSSKTALIVGHRKTNEVILAKLLNGNLASLHGKKINIKNKYVYEIALGETPKITTLRLGGAFHGKRWNGIKDD
jgi:broad specificity phosphatase PhoE